jgi:hypothetical protein
MIVLLPWSYIHLGIPESSTAGAANSTEESPSERPEAPQAFMDETVSS